MSPLYALLLDKIKSRKIQIRHSTGAEAQHTATLGRKSSGHVDAQTSEDEDAFSRQTPQMMSISIRSKYEDHRILREAVEDVQTTRMAMRIWMCDRLV